MSLALDTFVTLGAGLAAALDRPLKALGAATGAFATVKEAIVLTTLRYATRNIRQQDDKEHSVMMADVTLLYALCRSNLPTSKRHYKKTARSRRAWPRFGAGSRACDTRGSHVSSSDDPVGRSNVLRSTACAANYQNTSMLWHMGN